MLAKVRLVVEHRGASCGLAGGKRRAGSDDARSVIPLLRALSCGLIPHVWMPYESPVSVLFETLTDGGGGRWLVTLSYGRSGARLFLVLCVGAVDVWVVVYFFLFPGYGLLGL
uniref:Uncharacterized protein n=1 Tax=Oryza meridionalis TaxID=40149 RepID=A0A0E0EEZ9_9ORYZ